MGLAGRRRRPPLPAPTESSVGAFDEDTDSTPPIAPSDIETNLTTRTDKTHYSIPDDGSPIVIKTDKLRAQPKNIKLTNRSKGNTSQTSLLIEYFEADQDDPEGKGKPSVRVRVTPSAKNKSSGDGEPSPGSAQARQKNRGRAPIHDRHIDLEEGEDGVLPLGGSEISSLAGSELTAPPLDFGRREDRTGRRGLVAEEDNEESHLTPINMSEISSMPADSLLATDMGLESPTKPLNRRRSRSLDRGMEEDGDGDLQKLKPSPERTRSLSRERMVARKAVERFEREARERKYKDKERDGKHRRSSKSRSASNEHLASSSGKPRRKSSRSYDKDDDLSNPSLLTGSGVSGYSGHSAQSTSSLSKNPKLLQTVEDAIRRLILPEIDAIKNEQKSQRRSDRYDDELSSNASSVRSDARSSRRASGGKSGPKLKLNGDTIKSTKGSRRSGGGKESFESIKREFERGASEETVVREDKSRRRSKDKSKEIATGAAAAAAAATAASLTYAALKSQDSASSIERRERRKKRSKSHSRSTSRADSVEDVFAKHDVAPMPLVGGLTDSDLTRESILSERTSTPTHERNREVRDLVKDSPNEPSPGGSITPTGHASPLAAGSTAYRGAQRFGESIHLKKEPLHAHPPEDYLEDDEEDDYAEDEFHDSGYAQDRPYMPMTGLYSHTNYSSPNYRYERRGLSPIQSVASFEERGEEPPEDFQHQEGFTSMHSGNRDVRQEKSFDSVSSGTADMIERKALAQKSIGPEAIHDPLHGHHVADDAMAAGLLGQDIRRLGANAQLIETPHRAESAVASLMDPSTLGERSNLSYGSNELGSPGKRYSIETDPRRNSVISQERNLHTPERSSPLKREIRHDDDTRDLDDDHHYYGRPAPVGTPSRDRRDRSARSSPFEHHPQMHHSALPTNRPPMPDDYPYDDDDVETNPSEIRDDPWDHKEPHHADSTHDSLREAAKKNLLVAAGALGAGAALAQHHKAEHDHDFDKMDLDRDSPRHSESPGVRELQESPVTSKHNAASPWAQPDFPPLAPLVKDEGYHSGAPGLVGALSDGTSTPDPYQSKDPFVSGGRGLANDPFGGAETPEGDRPTTGISDAMPSPLFDAATGRGMDRIKNQDIVALMDHLTVRDAQRNARDTEILVTLVQSAAEMRNSFDDMKRLVATQEEKILDSNSKQHVETRRAINGPRAMPVGKALSNRTTTAADLDPEDVPTKKRNLFRKALRGLGGGSKQDLGNIENMLVQLLEEMAELRAAQQVAQPVNIAPAKMSSGLTSYEQLRDAPQERQNVQQMSGRTANVRNDAGYSSTDRSYQPAQHVRRGSGILKLGVNRVSTVHEADEEDDAESPLDEREQNILGNDETDTMLTPTREFRGTTVATGAPQANQRQSLSVENTPETRKHRSGSSSFFPKISRWSKTTASSVPGLDQTPRRDSQTLPAQQYTPSKSRGQRPVSELSRSVSELDDEYDVRDHYDPTGDDRLRSKTSLSNHSASREVRPPSPLIPSTVSEKPTYSAHRDSKDLQHPQPRQGPTARFQNHLESEAARGWFNDGTAVADSPGSDVMGNNPVLSRFGGREKGDRYSGASYGAQGAGELGTIMENSSANGGPPRPPKVKDEGPLVPPKVPVEQSGGPTHTRTVQFATDRMAQIIGTQSRKPSGPRPITRTGSASPAQGAGFNDWKKQQYRASPDHIPSDEESETF